MGFAQVEIAGPLSRAAGERPEAVMRRFRSLSPERYPRLIEIATAAATSQAEDEFRAGLELLLSGLAGLRDRQPATTVSGEKPPRAAARRRTTWRDRS